MSIRAIPKWYRGTRFRSTLEADWACTFDALGWAWQYEPVGVDLSDGTWYRPDFYLPSQRVWAEVKGPHNERVVKPELLHEALGIDEWEWSADLVVILRPPGPGEVAQWESVAPGQDIVIVRCPECWHDCFMDHNGTWSCRRHMRNTREPNKFWTAPGGAIYWPGDLPFTRTKTGRAA